MKEESQQQYYSIIALEVSQLFCSTSLFLLALALFALKNDETRIKAIISKVHDPIKKYSM